ncbi:MAG: hypothetical protein ABJG14_18555 [Sulfitobacter sp.]|uniref:hypothetical protein n=1 Tax=Alphaproteobacteria TaxID=28211 RepID=UPI0032642CF9
MTEDLHAALINATAAAADAALQPLSAPMRRDVANLLAQAAAALDALPGDGDNVVSIL